MTNFMDTLHGTSANFNSNRTVALTCNIFTTASFCFSKMKKNSLKETYLKTQPSEKLMTQFGAFHLCYGKHFLALDYLKNWSFHNVQNQYMLVSLLEFFFSWKCYSCKIVKKKHAKAAKNWWRITRMEWYPMNFWTQIKLDKLWTEKGPVFDSHHVT